MTPLGVTWLSLPACHSSCNYQYQPVIYEVIIIRHIFIINPSIIRLQIINCQWPDDFHCKHFIYEIIIYSIINYQQQLVKYQIIVITPSRYQISICISLGNLPISISRKLKWKEHLLVTCSRCLWPLIKKKSNWSFWKLDVISANTCKHDNAMYLSAHQSSLVSDSSRITKKKWKKVGWNFLCCCVSCSPV